VGLRRQSECDGRWAGLLLADPKKSIRDEFDQVGIVDAVIGEQNEPEVVSSMKLKGGLGADHVMMCHGRGPTSPDPSDDLSSEPSEAPAHETDPQEACQKPKADGEEGQRAAARLHGARGTLVVKRTHRRHGFLMAETQG
jgi:hypothetical protein